MMIDWVGIKDWAFNVNTTGRIVLLNTITYTRTSLGPVIEITWPLYCDTLYDYLLDNYNYCDATYNTTHKEATLLRMPLHTRML